MSNRTARQSRAGVDATAGEIVLDIGSKGVLGRPGQPGQSVQ